MGDASILPARGAVWRGDGLGCPCFAADVKMHCAWDGLGQGNGWYVPVLLAGRGRRCIQDGWDGWALPHCLRAGKGMYCVGERGMPGGAPALRGIPFLGDRRGGTQKRKPLGGFRFVWAAALCRLPGIRPGGRARGTCPPLRGMVGYSASAASSEGTNGSWVSVSPITSVL